MEYKLDLITEQMEHFIIDIASENYSEKYKREQIKNVLLRINSTKERIKKQKNTKGISKFELMSNMIQQIYNRLTKKERCCFCFAIHLRHKPCCDQNKKIKKKYECI